MNTKTLNRTLLFAVLSVATIHATGNSDYDRIKRDINVMAQIFRGAFETDGKSRGIAIDANYLAGQGATFTLNNHNLRSINLLRGDGSGGMAAFPMPPMPVAPKQAAQVAEEIHLALEGLEDFEWNWEGDVGQFQFYDRRMSELEKETREGIRDLAREARDIEREINEQRIELIQEEEQKSRQAIEGAISKLDKHLAEIVAKQSKLEAHLAAERDKANARRAEEREKALQARTAQLAQVERSVMQALCDYGSTLKNLPDKEHVSIIFSQAVSADERQIYVFDKKEVTDCRGGADELLKQATAYTF